MIPVARRRLAGEKARPAGNRAGVTGPTFRRILTIAAGLVALVALSTASIACGDGGFGGMGDMEEMHREMHGGGSQAPQTPVASDASELTLDIRDFDFFPRELTVAVGTALTWVNRDAAPHDATDEAGDWGTGMLNEGESASLTFDAPRSYRYFCTIHPDMKATLRVV
jgi:plastocyanin